MAETLTKEQRQAVENRGGMLLVSAAAGSGKTKVLVDRLMGYILDPKDPANIDDFLIITYTKAAAAELRGKIAAKLSELIAQGNSGKHLQQQMQRLYLAKISTVHGFCTDILRQYAYRLDVSADFRVADEGESLQLQLKALDQVLDAAYETAQQNQDFCAFVDSQGLGRDDRRIPEIILKVYNSSRCHLHPEKWLQWCAGRGEESLSDVTNTPWGQYLIADLKRYISLEINAMNRCISAATGSDGMEKPVALFTATVAQLQALYDCKSWDEIVLNQSIDFGRLTFPKNCNDLQLVEQMKAVRNACKDGLAKRLRAFSDTAGQIINDLKLSFSAARGLVCLVHDFTNAYDRLKRNRGVLDFGDLEHKTLDLLLGKQRTGITALADEIGAQFREVMVDEYQDSNQIQDAIFNALTQKRQNCFMVGDVKQSIYQFRLADPSIFIEKYNDYLPAEAAHIGEGRKVLLSHNFRSSGGVISAVNDVFSLTMSPQVGGLSYGEAELLREGIPHTHLCEPEVSLYGIDVIQDTYAEEASFVADEICRLLDGSHSVRDGDKLRPIAPEDIVILLRSPGSVGAEFQYALQTREIRCTTGDSSDLLQTEEIATLRAILQVVNNPLQDIPLTAALVSPVFGFTAEDLASLRGTNRRDEIYVLLRDATDSKCCNFMNILRKLRSCANVSSVTELLSEVYKETKLLSIYSSMTDGEARLDNLQTFFQIASDYETTGPKELGRFLEYLDAAENRGLAGAGSQQEKGSVTIMSIHKSKGLEFPVVFLCGLSRKFNQESAQSQVLCDKDLGLGLDCVDAKWRVRYPTIAKRAISAKIRREGISEEMRVLYVAMTRARDRLIMTYAAKNFAADLQELTMRMDMCSSELLASEANCPGSWILQTALTKTESGEFFALGGKPSCTHVSSFPWKVSVASANIACINQQAEEISVPTIPQEFLDKISAGLAFTYANSAATQVPSKLTATQLKGRALDHEIAEGTQELRSVEFRKPCSEKAASGKNYGNAIHAVMQYIRFSMCDSANSIREDVQRMAQERLISPEQAEMVDCEKIAAFFETTLGKKLQGSEHVLREFKFSILEDAEKFYPDAKGEQILLQGIVDCALIEEDTITVLDFKTDYVTEDTLPLIMEKYRLQVLAYSNALARIYQMPVQRACLYFFALNRFVDVI